MLAGCALLLGFTAVAQAEETVTIIEAGFSPDKLGVPTNVFGRAKFGSTNLPVPSPITHFTAFGPAGATINLEGTGTCTAAKLENVGPEACPADSRAGFGEVEGAYRIESDPEIIHENATIDFFLANNHPGHVELLLYLNGSSPVSLQIVFTAMVIQGPKPYGLGFSLNVPLIKVLPEASDASAVGGFLSIGARNVAYYKKVHGKRKLFHVKGLITPKSCPRGGWPVETVISFEDGSTVTAKHKIACPKK
ncbi:MAG TPA: hypothetical protein VES65_05235 [Solirubrobacteraceae bacterium]|nr:hypothetical protein [Solirubrobacteraceae bacterium]